MEHHCENSNSSDGSLNVHSPLRYESGLKPQLSSKATAFSIDALIGKRKFSDLNDTTCSSDNEEICDTKSRQVCDSVPTKRQRVDVCLAPLGKRVNINNCEINLLKIIITVSFLECDTYSKNSFSPLMPSKNYQKMKYRRFSFNILWPLAAHQLNAIQNGVSLVGR